ncbi:HNH endonuclease signature motif containing protein [Peribacillus frigoritolerans]|uniref:HNH endonuclease n=1 Tax=Peribacillus frigoritolerans TaxID=450367 RepID=UPI002E2230EC|nr:HNH endonuclease signature motif containing protein [Peribacillus frigoritolerans]MED3848854.1 HNH endonuclease signature motif containing protein [Peribacillus frigoritolerans]
MENIIDDVITETEKEQLIKSRIGQSTFKKTLLAIEKKCRLCGISDERFLVASHIKPWSKSDNQERLDVNNGLLLCPNSLFDKGYISFDDDGTILISDSLDEATKVFLNINESMSLEMNESQKQLMKWHWENVFENRNKLNFSGYNSPVMTICPE